jgi:hypothetical protein
MLVAPKKCGPRKDPPKERSLRNHGVDKYLAERVRKAAAMPEEKFEARLTIWAMRPAEAKKFFPLPLCHPST